MRTIRHRPPAPQLTGGICADQAWAKAPCANPAISHLWDLELDGNGAWSTAETKPQRIARHEEAKRICVEDCPALQLCAGLDTTGRQGVIAGRVVT